ncbi:hypothetical protein [Marinomonas pollencensis]|uniref:Uncharacterized protein n=1 Tax=Marinomonas pollencensis TaxID=491954 RepID=A0A3E0DJV1_9GAMM|nr:hypothetical protein [Marinomonas pollencensis]REG83023.1 hypothetical protein DFP81_107203 [Marinomonas pollencensis]
MAKKYKRNIPSWTIALATALGLHFVVIFLLNTYGNFEIFEKHNSPSKHELEVTFIEQPSLPNQKEQQQLDPASHSTMTASTPAPQEERPDNTATNNKTPSTSTPPPLAESIKAPDQGVTGDVSTKASLLDLSHFSLSPNVESKATQKIFSAELQKKIAASKQAQKEYLKGTQQETNYPITEDADGTRYVNIKGVCWRIPKDSSKDSWAIVFDGCGLKDKSFHFELNISPSMLTNELLGPDSPFTLEK